MFSTFMRSNIFFGTAFSMPSWLTAATNFRCSSTDHTTLGFFCVDESPFSLLFSSESSPSSPFSSLLFRDCLLLRLAPILSPSLFIPCAF
ncbi:Os02g0182200 [Oryza sativa Japonica Group]|uniref:Os02g0182200 protein n=1 Tax=Oryza sativa subsp. japonica TaxID=39947 RepID=A0A0P0VFI2_ORYSJ|nr:hypothetical protein EE612_009303 [Oryza sativa]BAS77315.1 Os02g0182200 [Oryza sativa Japonica Group]